ncbi:DUF642 domain-containing protein [Streptomyces microflavus]|uniref:DUF642 domain-containing protein n=1 Tax=Streptomyces microflavus TaxID=1919 RepID=UPI0037F26F66
MRTPRLPIPSSVSSAATLSAAVLLLCATAPASASAAAPASASEAAPRVDDAATERFTTGLLSGGFETPAVPPPTPFTVHTAGQTLGPWTVGGDSVDLVSDRFWDAAGGHQSVDLSGNAPGSVSQTVPTLPLTSYIVRFKLAGNVAQPPAVKKGEFRVNGAVVRTFSFDSAGRGFRDMGYVQQTAVFTTLLHTSATLTFASTTPGYAGPVIDDVVVQSCLLVLCPPTG